MSPLRRVVNLAACHLLGKFPLVPFAFLAGWLLGSMWYTLTVLLVGFVAVNQIYHRTWIYVDPDFYHDNQRVLMVSAVIAYLNWWVLLALRHYLNTGVFGI